MTPRVFQGRDSIEPPEKGGGKEDGQQDGIGAQGWRADDCGVFQLPDPMMPSRLKGAFPEGVELKRVGLAEAVAETKAFLAARADGPPHPALSPHSVGGEEE